MHYRYHKPGHALQKVYPFVCLIMPFICSINPCISPLVGHKQPLVGTTKIEGFTLIELIITLTIMGILTALAAPGMGNFIQDQRLSGQTNDFVGDLNLARSEAIKRSTNITICKQDPASTASLCNTAAVATWSAGWVILIDSNNDSQVTAGETVLRVRQALAGTGNIMTSAATDTTGGPFNNAANLVIYLPSGLTTIKPGVTAQFRLCDNRGPSKARTIQLISTGRATANSAPAASCPTSSNW